MEDFISKLTYYGDLISGTDDEDDEEIEVEVQPIHFTCVFSIHLFQMKLKTLH